MPDPTLRDRLAAALRTAPVRGTVMRMTVLTELYGPVDALADAVLAVTQPLLDAKDTEIATAREAARQRAEMLEEARDMFTQAGINRAHGDDWPDIIPALRELIQQRDAAHHKET